MIFTATPVEGAYVVDLEPHLDARGSFARAFCRREFAAVGIHFDVVQSNLARTTRAGVVRGLHYQTAPAEEAKLVRCIAGSVFDAIVDMRPGSATYLRSWWTELRAVDGRALFIPEGVAHGYQSLTAGAEVLYMTNAYYAPDRETGLRFDDPALRIPWPLPARDVTARDRVWPLLDSPTGSG